MEQGVLCCDRGGMRNFGICVGVLSDVLSFTIWWVACICISGVNAAGCVVGVDVLIVCVCLLCVFACVLCVCLDGGV